MLEDHKQNIDLCVVMPVRNEKDCLIAVVDELCATLSTIPRLKQVALLIVDDFSQDGGIELLKQWFKEQKLDCFSLTIIRLQYRHGMGNALLKGFKLAVTWRPHLTLVMDADGQHDPSCLAELVKLSASTDIVWILRGRRGDLLFFRFCYAFFQTFMQLVTGQRVRTGSFCLLKLPVLTYLSGVNYIDYLAALLNTAPFNCTEITVERRARIAGQPKFGFCGHALTAAVYVSYLPRLLTSFNCAAIVLLVVLGGVAISAKNSMAIAIFVVFAVLLQLWHMLLTGIIVTRSTAQPLALRDGIERVEACDGVACV